MDRRSWGFLLALSAIWGVSYLLIKIGLRDLSPEMVAFCRIALAALVLLPIAVSRSALAPLRGRGRWLVLLAGIQVAAPFLLISAGEGEISSSLAGILVASAPIFTAVLALRLDREERSEGSRLAGIAIGIAGMITLFGLDLTGSGSAALGGMAVVLAGFGYALGGFILKARFSDVPPIGLVAGVMTVSAALLAPAALLTAPAELPALGPVAAVAVLGIVGTGIAFVIFYWLIARVGPARATLVAYIAPGFAVIYGATLLDEAITAGKLIGLALILAGSWLGAGKPEGLPDERPSEPAYSPLYDAARRSGATR